MNTDQKRSTILVTGGAGYIGSHTCLELLQANFNVVVVDNLVNASEESLKRVKEITGKAVEKLLSAEGIKGVQAYNLGTGNGISVLEMVKAFATINNVSVPYTLVDRRPGDVAACYADATRAKEELNWVADMSLEDMVKDSWHWQSQNPEGYKV
jgi:UDP-glucose 4-epimerase